MFCSDCLKPCKGKMVDFGIGPNEFWGVVENHADWQAASDCCETEIYAYKLTDEEGNVYLATLLDRSDVIDEETNEDWRY